MSSRKYRQSEKEALEERARIDAAMEQLENAKQKARAQRAEYGKYLEWKVKMQRKERHQRAVEEAQMRERIDEKLRTILKEHREQKHKDRVAWSEFSQNAVPKRRPVHLPDSSRREDEYMESVNAEKERKRAEIDATRAAIKSVVKAPASAPARVVPRSKRVLPNNSSSSNSASLAAQSASLQLQQAATIHNTSGATTLANTTSSAYTMVTQPRVPGKKDEVPKYSTTKGGMTIVNPKAMSPATAEAVEGVVAMVEASRLRSAESEGAANSSGGAASARGGKGGDEKPEAVSLIITPATERLIEQSKMEGQIDMDTVSKMTLIPEITSTMQSTLSPEQEAERSAIDRSRRHVDRRRNLVTDMYNKATKARLYATSRMMADPPADYLIGNDVMRYIPADMLADEDAEGPNAGISGDMVANYQPPTKSGDDFFMTHTDAELPPPQRHEAITSSPHRSPQDLDDVPDGDLDVENRERTVGAGTKKKQLMWKKFDPDAWMHLPEKPPVHVVQERLPEEETATLEWYKTYHEKYTKIKKRTESTNRPYNWSHQGRHMLPKLKSTKFDQE